MRLSYATAALILGAAPFATAQAHEPMSQMSPDGALLTLRVSETVESAPDIATMSAGVRTQEPTASAALAANSVKMKAVIDELRRRGVADRDIQTSGISLEPRYDYKRENDAPPQFLGYTVTNRVTVRARDIQKLGPLIDALVAVGANDLNGPSFLIDNDKALLQSARDKALASAETQARYYAQKTGFARARLVSISEGVSGDMPTPPVMFARDAVVVTGSRVKAPVQPGEVSTGVTLTVTYRLERQ